MNYFPKTVSRSFTENFKAKILPMTPEEKLDFETVYFAQPVSVHCNCKNITFLKIFIILYIFIYF